MTAGAVSGGWRAVVRAPVPVVARPVEWWEWLLAARDAWRSAYPRLMRVVSAAGVAVVWLAVPVLVVVLVVVPWLREVLWVAVPCWWLLVCWFVLARTKTISWGLYARMFVVAVPWSMGIAVFSAWLWPQAVGGAGDVGASVGIAPVTEESLKLLPVLAVVVLAPGRARRFAVTDWLLLGVACGLGFTLVEEMARRAIGVAGPSFGDATADFSLSPVSGGLHMLVGDVVVTYAGHHVHTALVGVAVGFAVVWWRRGRHGPGPVRVLWRAAASLVPVLAWWLAVTDHAGWNATVASFDDFSVDSLLAWAEESRVPSVIGWTWTTFGHGQGRGGLLLVLLAVALLVDARSMHQADRGVPLDPELGWTDPDVLVGRTRRWSRRLLDAGAGTPAVVAAPLRWAVTLLEAVLALATYLVRDLVVVVVAHARDPAPDQQRVTPAGRAAAVLEPARAGIARGRVAVAMIRTARLDAFDVASGPIRHLAWIRLAALAALGLLLAAAWPLALSWASGIGDHLGTGGSWLAGLLDDLATWWNSMSGFEQLVVFAGIVALLVLGGATFGASLWAAGALTFLLSQGHTLAAFTRNPKQATTDYLTKTPPHALATDLLQWGLALSPGNRLRVFGRRGVREATERYATSPHAWRQARRAAARREGEGTFAKMREELWRRGRSPRPGYEPGTALRQRIEAGAARQEEELRRLGFGDGTPTARNDKLQKYIGEYFKHYKEPGTFGNGATPDAIRYELSTGLPGSVQPDGKSQWHLKKGRELLNGLDSWVEKQKKHPSATQRDKALASYMRQELRRAFKEGGVDVPR